MTERPVATPPSNQLRHWALAVLCLLRERPMHPYEMRRVMKLRAKDQRLELKPGSLYNAVSWLLQHDLIETVGRSRQGRRPPRTVYAIRPAGEREIARWLGEQLVEVRQEVSGFTVALDHLVQVSPKEAIVHLTARRKVLKETIDGLAATLRTLTPRIGRINLLETEYDLARFRAQHAWLGRIVEELRDGTLDWNTEEILAAVRNQTASS